YDLLLSLDERDGRLEFDADLFEPATVGSWLRGLVTLLEAALAAPDTPVGELPLGETVLVGPAGEEGPLVHQLLARAAPDALAVVAPDGRLTYAELRRRARSLARRLAAEGVRPGDRVAFCLPR